VIYKIDRLSTRSISISKGFNGVLINISNKINKGQVNI
jgi:hypothetical protein